MFNRHRGGKIRTIAAQPINTLQVLRDMYTPGVARVCLAIRKDPQAAHEFTNRDSTVAIVTNGTAVLGLGDIGPLAGLPVMEGKAALFADLVGLSGVPILVNETQPDRVVDTIIAIEMSFGAIQLEDFAAPECFVIEQRLRERIAKPILHDDQHGTAVVALAALINAAAKCSGRCTKASSARSAWGPPARASSDCSKRSVYGECSEPIATPKRSSGCDRWEARPPPCRRFMAQR